MRLQRFGALLFLVGIVAIVLLQLGIPIPIRHGEHALRIAGIVGLGTGVVVITLGTILRGASTAHKPEYRTDWHMVPRQGRAAPFGNAIQREYQQTTALPGRCSNCRNPLVADAKFCPRCGAAVANEVRPAPMRQGSMEPMEFTPPRGGNQRPGPKFGMFRMLVFLAAIVGGSYVLAYWQHYHRVPWENWKWACDLCQSTNVSTSNESLSLPTAPDPRAPAASTTFQAGRCYIGNSSIETAVDGDGSVGIRVHARIYSALATGLRFGAHLQFSDFGRVYATDARYRDANGQAATTVPVPESTSPVDVTAFIPNSALTLQEGNFSLEALASLYDASNRPIGLCQVLPFTYYRGPASITRVQIPAPRAINNLTGPLRTFNVNYTIAHPQAGSTVAVVVRFKDENGRTVPGHSFYVGQLGELRAESRHVVAAGTGPLTVTGQAVVIPASLIPPGATAEITVCNAPTETAISQTVAIRMP